MRVERAALQAHVTACAWGPLAMVVDQQETMVRGVAPFPGAVGAWRSFAWRVHAYGLGRLGCRCHGLG